MRPELIALGVFAFVSACHSRMPTVATPDPDLSAGFDPELVPRPRYVPPSCLTLRPVPAFGSVPWTGPPIDSHCPVHVRLTEHGGVTAEALSLEDRYPTAPGQVDVPPEYSVGTRRVIQVEDGFLVAYAGAFEGQAMWVDETGYERKFVSRARFAGFVRAPSGTILALGVGQARLGRGGVVALDRRGPGDYVPRLIATLPFEPQPIAFDDHGALVTVTGNFLVRIDEHGQVENLHYFARDIGRVASMISAPNGDRYLGLDCGVLKLTPDGEESWWSAGDGAAGAAHGWPACEEPEEEDMMRYQFQVIY